MVSYVFSRRELERFYNRNILYGEDMRQAATRQLLCRARGVKGMALRMSPASLIFQEFLVMPRSADVFGSELLLVAMRPGEKMDGSLLKRASKPQRRLAVRRRK